MNLKDYYRILGVARDASAKDIRRAFRHLAMQYHPDHNPENTQEAEERFKEINEAYTVLGDEHKRWQYDRLTGLSGYPRRAVVAEDILSQSVESDSWIEMIRRVAGLGFASTSFGHRVSRGYGRRQGKKCRWQQWRD